MSEDNVELMRRFFREASRKTDPEGRTMNPLDPGTMALIRATLDPAIELHEDPSFPEAGVYRGPDAVVGYWSQFLENYEEFLWELEDLIGVDDDRVLVLLRLTSRGKGSGVAIEAHPAWIYTLRDGLVVRIETYLDRGQALEAVGLQA